LRHDAVTIQDEARASTINAAVAARRIGLALPAGIVLVSHQPAVKLPRTDQREA
jgi:hypothetical protein